MKALLIIVIFMFMAIQISDMKKELAERAAEIQQLQADYAQCVIEKGLGEDNDA
jgi:outer membrane lipoprotein-sorting protein